MSDDTGGFTTAPGVLIAVPQLLDPNFDHTVVVMVEHDRAGALGLVINQPTPGLASDVTSTFGLPWAGATDDPLLRGGPVQPQSLWMLHDDGWCFDETMKVGPGIAVSRSREALGRMCQGDEASLRLLIGYAGWSAGQLEEEIAAGSWIVAPLSVELVFDWPAEEIWRRALGLLGIDPAHLVAPTSTLQ